jgi:uncharacterized membrane protein
MPTVEPAASTPFWTPRMGVVLLLLCAYPLLAHAEAASGNPYFAWTAWLCLVGAISLALPWKAGLCVAVALLTPLAWIHADVLLRIPPVIIYLALGVWFGKSLLPGREPLISWFARMERVHLEQDLARYTRLLTLIWTVFFVSMSALSASLAVFAEHETWSLFTNGASYVLIALLFVGEYAYRRVRYSHYRHSSLPRMITMLYRGMSRRRAGTR